MVQTMGVDFAVWEPGDKVEARRVTGLPLERRIMLSSSRLVDKKGIHCILRALAGALGKYPDILYVATGNGPQEYEEQLKAIVRELHIEDNVRFAGRVDDSTLLDLYRAADVFVSASQREGGPISVMKAFATSTPVITTDVGNVAEMMREVGASFVVPPCDFHQLGEAIISFFSDSGKSRDLRAVAMQRYDWARIAKNTLGVYEELLQK